LGFFFATLRRAVESEPPPLPERPGRWPGLPPSKSARWSGTKFITPVRSLKPLTERDALIAATALTRRPTLGTHNSKEMARTGETILDPWVAKT
jgi:hypothetical protein